MDAHPLMERKLRASAFGAKSARAFEEAARSALLMGGGDAQREPGAVARISGGSGRASVAAVSGRASVAFASGRASVAGGGANRRSMVTVPGGALPPLHSADGAGEHRAPAAAAAAAHHYHQPDAARDTLHIVTGLPQVSRTVSPEAVLPAQQPPHNHVVYRDRQRRRSATGAVGPGGAGADGGGAAAEAAAGRAEQLRRAKSARHDVAAPHLKPAQHEAEAPPAAAPAPAPASGIVIHRLATRSGDTHRGSGGTPAKTGAGGDDAPLLAPSGAGGGPPAKAPGMAAGTRSSRGARRSIGFADPPSAPAAGKAPQPGEERASAAAAASDVPLARGPSFPHRYMKPSAAPAAGPAPNPIVRALARLSSHQQRSGGHRASLGRAPQGAAAAPAPEHAALASAPAAAQSAAHSSTAAPASRSSAAAVAAAAHRQLALTDPALPGGALSEDFHPPNDGRRYSHDGPQATPARDLARSLSSRSAVGLRARPSGAAALAALSAAHRREASGPPSPDDDAARLVSSALLMAYLFVARPATGFEARQRGEGAPSTGLTV